jgi:hypothetical protein
LVAAGSELLCQTLLPRKNITSICRRKLLIKIQAFQRPISKAGTSDTFYLTPCIPLSLRGVKGEGEEFF